MKQRIDKSTVRGLAILIVVSMGGVTLWGLRFRSDREQRDTLDRLRRQNPSAAVLPWPGVGRSVPVGLDLPTCRVDYIRFDKEEDTPGALTTVGLLGIKDAPQAALVNVEILDRAGEPIGSYPVANFTEKELSKNQWRDVKDVVRFSLAKEPAFVIVNADATPAAFDSKRS